LRKEVIKGMKQINNNLEVKDYEIHTERVKSVDGILKKYTWFLSTLTAIKKDACNTKEAVTSYQ